MKKAICILLIVLMTVSVCACAGAKEPNVEQNSSAVAENDVSGVSSSVSYAKTESKEIAVSDESRESSETDAASDATSDTTSDLLAGHIMELPDDLFEGGRPIGVNGDWIYYADKNHLLLGRVHLDGSNRLRYENKGVANANVENDRIYYINANDGDRLYVMNHDGTGATMLCEDAVSYNTPLAIVGDRVFYKFFVPCQPDDWSSKDLSIPYSIKTDGTDRQKLGDNNVPQALPQSDGWIYNTWGERDGGRIYKIHPDGSEKTYLTDFKAKNLKVHDGWIYYTIWPENSLSENYLFRMRTDGTDNQKFCDDEVGSLYHATFDEMYVYYENCSDKTEQSIGSMLIGKLYAIKTDGTDRRKLCDHTPSTSIFDRTLSLFVEKDTLFFHTSIDNKRMLYAIDKDGTNERCIAKNDAIIILKTDSGFFYESDDAMYFYSYEKIEK